jgi:hypothetical protein
MNAFYPAFSPACFSLLGLWLVVVQIRLPQWQASPGYPVYRKASYGIALHFALPGLMSVLALVDQNDPDYWRISFAIVALGGAVTLAAMRGPVGGTLGVASYAAAIAGYTVAGALAIHGGHSMLSVEEILLTALVFVGFNAAWLLLFDDGGGAPAEEAVTEVPSAGTEGPAVGQPGAGHGADGVTPVRSS